MKNNENKLPVLTLKKVVHQREVLLTISFKYNHDIKDAIKAIGDSYFNQTLRAWYCLHEREIDTTKVFFAWKSGFYRSGRSAKYSLKKNM